MDENRSPGAAYFNTSGNFVAPTQICTLTQSYPNNGLLVYEDEVILLKVNSVGTTSTCCGGTPVAYRLA